MWTKPKKHLSTFFDLYGSDDVVDVVDDNNDDDDELPNRTRYIQCMYIRVKCCGSSP